MKLDFSAFIFVYLSMESSSVFTCLSQLQLDLNIDRLLPYFDGNFLAAAYHLDKDT